jgi:hypothetical protein
MRRADTMVDLLAAVLRGSLSRSEEAILYAAVDAAVTGRAEEPALGDLAGAAPRRCGAPPAGPIRAFR